MTEARGATEAAEQPFAVAEGSLRSRLQWLTVVF